MKRGYSYEDIEDEKRRRTDSGFNNYQAFSSSSSSSSSSSNSHSNSISNSRSYSISNSSSNLGSSMSGMDVFSNEVFLDDYLKGFMKENFDMKKILDNN